MIRSIYAKSRLSGRLYKVELKYKANGKYVLRPTDGKPYQWLELCAGQIKDNFRLFPIVGV